MQAIKLSMQQHSDDYSFLKAKEEDPPDYKIVHRYATRGGDKRAFIVVDSPTLDAPITLTRQGGNPHKSESSQSWYPTYGYGQPYAYGNSKYKVMSLKHVQQLEDSILNDGESRQRHSASDISSTQDAFDTIFADWKDNDDIFPRNKSGAHKHKPGLQAFIEEAVENQEGPKREAYNKWMDHVKSLARSAPRLDKKGSYGDSDYGKTFKSEWGLTDTIAQVIRQSHHTWLSEGQPDSENMRHFNFPSLETMHVEGAGRQFKKADSPEGLINKNFSEDSSVRASLLPLMRIIHHINENSDIENSSVWKADATGLEAGSQLDEGDYEIHKVDSFLPENADNINAIHQNAINDRVAEGVVTQEKADGALLNQPAFLERLKLSINPGNVIPKLAGILADKSAVHSSAQSFGGMLVNTIKGAPPTKGFDHPNVPSEAENSVDAPEVPKSITDYFNGGLGKPPMSREQFDLLSPLRQHIMIDRMISVSEAANTRQDFHDAVAGLSDDLHKTKSDTYLSSDDLLSDKSPYSEDVSRILPETLSTDEAPVETPEEQPVPAAAEEVTPEDTAPAEQVDESEIPATAEDDDPAVEDEDQLPDRKDVEQDTDSLLDYAEQRLGGELRPPDDKPDFDWDNVVEVSNAIRGGDMKFVDNQPDHPIDAKTREAILTDIHEQHAEFWRQAGGGENTGAMSEEPIYVANMNRLLSEFETAETKASESIGESTPEDAAPVAQVEEVATEDSDSGFNTAEQGALEIIGQAIKNPQTPLSQLPLDVQLGIAQAALQIERVEAKDISDLEKKSPNANANEREKFIASANSKRTLLIRAVESGDLKNINEQVQNFRGDNYERTTSRATNQGGTGRPDAGGAREPAVSGTEGDAEESGVDEGDGEEVEDTEVDGESAGGPVPDEVAPEEPASVTPDADAEQDDEDVVDVPDEVDDEDDQDDAQEEQEEIPADGDVPPPPPPPPAADEEPEEDPARKFRQQHLDDIGDEVLETLIKPRHRGYHDLESLKNTLLDSDKIKDDKFDAFLETAETAHTGNQEKERRTSSKSHRALRDSIRNKKGLHEVIQEHIADHVATHDGRDVHDLKYKDLGTYVRHLNSLSDDDRRKELEDHQKTAATRVEDKEKEEAKAAEKEETEATKQKEEEDKSVWAVESKRVQEQMAAMPTILGSDGRKVSDQWDNSSALHYFRNLNKIVVHDTRVNLEKAGIDLSEISSLGSLLNALGAGDRIPTEIYGKITNSSSAINAVLTPRQKRDLAEEMETVNDYMGPEHRKQLAIENNQARKNEEDYQERQNDVVDGGISHSIYSKTANDKYRDKDGKIIPLYSDPEDMKKKDEADALRRQEDNVGEETPSEKAKRRTSQGHPPTESPGEGYAYHPETGQWVDRERFDSMAAHFDQHLKPGETTSFAPAHTVHTEHIGKDENGKRGVVLKAHEPLARGTKGASDYVSVTKNKEGQLIWSPVKPPEQNKHGFISPDAVQHDTGDLELDGRLDNAHAVGQYKGAWHALDHEEASSADHARHGMQNNIIRHHSLGGRGAPKNVVPMDDDINGVLRKENFSNIAGNILNFSRKHGGSLAKKLKLGEMPEKVGQSAAGQRVGEAAQQVGETARKIGAAAKDVTGLYSARDVASLFYNPTAQPKLYRRLLFGSTKKDEALGMPSPGEGVAGAAKKVREKVAPVVSDIAGRAAEDVSGAALAAGANIDRATARASDAKEKVTDKVREGVSAGSEKINQATAVAADKAGKIIDRTKEGASQVGQDIASTGMAGAGGVQPSSTGAPPETSKNKLTEDPTQTRKLREGQAKLKAIRERQNSGVGEASRTEEHGTAVDAFHNFTVENRAERDGITGTDAPDLTPVKPNRAQRRAAEGKGAKKRVGIPSQTESTTTTTTPTAAPQPRPRGGYEALT
jgi:hypothetical protein